MPVGVLELWIDESYRALAPKRLVKSLEETPPLAGSGHAEQPRNRRASAEAATKHLTGGTKCSDPI